MSDSVDREYPGPKLYADPKSQARYERNRAKHIKTVTPVVEAVKNVFYGEHCLLCFAPFEDGSGDYGCCCAPDVYDKAREIVLLVRSYTAQEQSDV